MFQNFKQMTSNLSNFTKNCQNWFSGRKRNVEHWIGHPNFDLINHDIVNPLYIEVDEIYHLASPASPPHYMYNPVKTIKTNTVGAVNALGLAKRVNAKILIASTSEVYGDPEVSDSFQILKKYTKPKNLTLIFWILGTSTKWDILGPCKSHWSKSMLWWRQKSSRNFSICLC